MCTRARHTPRNLLNILTLLTVTWVLTAYSVTGASAVPTLAHVNGTIYFVGNNPEHGDELWKSDGTAAGTALVKDITPGSGNTLFKSLVAVGATLLFFANDGGGWALWTSEGTDVTTLIVKRVSAPGDEAVSVNGMIYFGADDGVHGTELWRSDGTEAGTTMVRDINPTGGSSPYWLTVINGVIYFGANDGVHGFELWKSDGTPGGTAMVEDINPTGNSLPSWLTDVNGTLFFAADDGVHGMELWRSDGSPEGTAMVEDINPAGSSSPLWLTNVNEVLFFSADDGVRGMELWRSDGSPEGTAMVKDINPGGSSPYGLTDVNGTLFFAADDGAHGMELWRSDGSPEGTAMVEDINPAGSSSPSWLRNVDGVLFFSADDSVHGRELWASLGTAAGTAMVDDINPGSGDSSPSLLTNVDGVLFFSAASGAGQQLFVLRVPSGLLVLARVQTLIGTYYRNVLDRSFDEEGLDFWTSEVARIVSLGVDIREGFQALARLFFNSQEYLSKEKLPEEFVTDLYETFLKRKPDDDGRDHWVGQLQAGLTRDMLITEFANCDEFKLYLQGIFGDSNTRPENNLVNDLYRGFLNRLPDSAGFNHWLKDNASMNMRSAQCSGAPAVRNLTYQIALAFIQSNEYTNRHRSDSQYVEDLYNGILKRGADPGGYIHWVNLLNNGTYNRVQMLSEFTNSREFQTRVQEVINAGCLQ